MPEAFLSVFVLFQLPWAMISLYEETLVPKDQGAGMDGSLMTVPAALIAFF